MDSIDARSTAADYLSSHGSPLWPDDDATPSRPASKKSTFSPLRRLFAPPSRSLLTQVAHVTAPFISTFLLIHLTAPVLANVGGSSLANQVMMVGREYYQTPFGERYLVQLPLALHVSASLLKRLLALVRPGGAPGTPEARLARPRPLSSLLAWSGYAAALALVPVHYLTHRAYPALAGAPVRAVGPSELDYEFVKAGLRAWPVRSWVLYGALVGAVALHAADGMFLLARTYGGKRAPGGRSAWRWVGALVAVPVLAGVYVMWKEPEMALLGLGERYRAAFQQSFLYRI